MENENQELPESEVKENKVPKYAIFGVIPLVLLAGFLFFKGSGGSSSTPTPNSTETLGENVSSTAEVPLETDKKEITINASNYAFDLKEINIPKGSNVKIIFNNTEGKHDFVIDEFGVKSKVLAEGGQEIIEFKTDAPGTFEYYCSVAEHRKMGMVGKIIVK